MNSNLNEETLRNLNPFSHAASLAAQSNVGSVRFESGELGEKRIVQISFERELPLPVTIAHQSQTPVNGFRCFGINE
jgi:hypothetical protein